MIQKKKKGNMSFIADVIPLKVGKLSVKDQVVNILGFGTL
jgi:hypothetical protein